MLESAHIVGACETWMRPFDNNKRIIYEECVTTIPTNQKRRGYGGVARAEHPAIPYEVLQTSAGRTGQYITIETADMHIKISYISLAVVVKTKRTLLTNLTQENRERVVIMGDLNARHTKLATVANAHGTRPEAWSTRNGWQVSASSIPTCKTI